MLKCLVFVALTYFMQSCETAGENNLIVQLPPSAKQDENFKPSVLMNGHNNYQAGEQIFYIYGQDQLKNSSWNLQRMHTCCANLSKIRDDYIVTPGIGAHKLHTAATNWNTARKRCIQEGAHLAIINSDAEEKVLLKMLAKEHAYRAWLGIHDLYKEGVWTTVLDQSLESTGFTKWSPFWARDSHKLSINENCGIIFEDGLDHIRCVTYLPFFCEIKLLTCTEEILKTN